MPNSLTWLTEFLEIVCSEVLEDTPEQFDIAKQKLVDNYSPGKRHKYSRIALLLRSPHFNECTSDQFDTARENFRYIESCYSKFVSNEEHRKWIEKLFDYLELEIDRIINVDRKLKNMQDRMNSYGTTLRFLQDSEESRKQIPVLAAQMSEMTTKAMSDSEDAIAKATKAMSDSEDAVKKVTEVLKKAQKASDKAQKASAKVKEFNTQSITILSIFTAVVFAFTGGFTMLGSAFSNLIGISRNESLLLIALVLIVGCILLDVIYFLIYFIGRISDIRIGVDCSLDCDNCSEKKKNGRSCGWKKFRHRHFVIKSVNVLVAAIILFILVFNWISWESSNSQNDANQTVTVHVIPELTPEATDVPATPVPTIEPTPETVTATPRVEKTISPGNT